MTLIKPNGQPDGTFLIQIDDGYCVHEYSLSGLGHLSIDDVAMSLAEALNCDLVHRGHVHGGLNRIKED